MIYQRNKISPVSVFFMLYISRVVVCLTNVQSVIFGELNSDILISLVLSLGLTIILSLPAIYCYKTKKSPFNIGFLGYFYFAYFVLISAISISRFSYFASTTLNPETRAIVFIVMLSICGYYATKLGIEAISRFSAFAFVLILIAVAVVLLFNVNEFNDVNLYPAISSRPVDILKNALILSSNTSEIIIFLCISDRVNGDPVKSFVGSIAASFTTIFALLYYMLGSLGDGARVQDFPVYTLFQIAKIGELQRLDVLHISFWILGVLVKVVLSTYCASISIKRYSSKTKCILSSVCIFALSLSFLLFKISGLVPVQFVIISFSIFCVLIPLLTLVFKRRSSVDELLESL